MLTLTRQLRTAATAAAVVAAMALGISPATASPPPEPADLYQPPAACPTRIDSVAHGLRAQGFAAPAAKNFALFIVRDCAAEI